MTDKHEQAGEARRLRSRLTAAERWERAEMISVIGFYAFAILTAAGILFSEVGRHLGWYVAGMLATGALIIVCTILQAHYEAADPTEIEEESDR